MLDKMPGDVWQKFANLRLLYGYQWSHPGKKLQFMGGEFGQWREWNEAQSLDWHLLDQDDKHRRLQDLVRELNELYRNEPALHEVEYSWEGFYWIDLHDSQHSILSYGRRARDGGDTILVICNFTPVVRPGYRLGVPEPGVYEEIMNTDAHEYGGSHVINQPRESSPTPWQDHPHSIVLTLPPLATVYWKRRADEEE
jgi:1,4-alpha-glucan branching enzyme